MSNYQRKDQAKIAIKKMEKKSKINYTIECNYLNFMNKVTFHFHQMQGIN